MVTDDHATLCDAVCCVDTNDMNVSTGGHRKRSRPAYNQTSAELKGEHTLSETIQEMDALTISQKQAKKVPWKCKWVSADKLGDYACDHVAAIAKAMIQLVVWRTTDLSASGPRRIEKVWSASAFMLCGERKLAITAEHNVEGVDKLGRGVICAYTHPQKASPNGGQYYATVIGFIGKGNGKAAVLQLHALPSDPKANGRLHAVKLATVGPKQGDKIRVVGIASVKGGDNTIRVLALTPGIVTSPGSGYREDGLVPCDLTMFEGLSGGAMTTQNGCVVALAEGVDSHGRRIAFATELVGVRRELEDLLRKTYNCGIDDLETDAPVSWAFTSFQRRELHGYLHKKLDEVNKIAKAEAESERSAKAVENADIFKTRIKDRVHKTRKDFIGRTWLAEKLLNASRQLQAHKVILITGIGGTGKSFFFNRLLDTVTCNSLGGNWAQLHNSVLARHCCMFEYSDSLETNRFLDSLVGQLLSAVENSGRVFPLSNKKSNKKTVDKLLCDHLHKPKHTNPFSIVAEVLVPALNAMGDAKALGGKCIILVDSLDEARSGGNIVAVLVDLIQKSPDWLRWVATSRPDSVVTKLLKAVEVESTEINLDGKDQEADVREYVETLLPVYPCVVSRLEMRMPAMEQVSAICKKAKGLFAYAAIAVKELTDNPNMDLKSLPNTLEEIYVTFFERKYPGDKLGEFDKYTAPILAILVASREAVPLELVKGDDLKRVEWHVLQESIDFVQRTFAKGRLLGKESQVMQLGHKIFADFVQSDDKAGRFAVRAGRGHALLAERCKRKLEKQSDPTEPCMQYVLKHLVHHLCYLHEHPAHRLDGTSGRDPLQELARVVLNFDWLFGRVMMDKSTKGALAECRKVQSLLQTRDSADQAELRQCVDVVVSMTHAATWPVFRDPRQFLGRIVLRLSNHHEEPLVELVRRAKECKKCQWWMFSDSTLVQVGNGEEVLSSIGHTAFRGCYGITTVDLPPWVTSIRPMAFENCYDITTVKFPEGLTSIARSSFHNCAGITAVTLPSSLTSLAESAFSGCAGITKLTLPGGLTSISKYVFSECVRITDLKLPENLTSIDDNAFAGCRGITTLTLPKNLTRIGYQAFSGCIGITTLSLPEKLVKIGSCAFRGCVGITALTLPKDLTTVSDEAFFGCAGITALTLPPGLTHIGKYSFSGCARITALSLPKSLVEIGQGAFQGCDGLTFRKLEMESDAIYDLFWKSFRPSDPLKRSLSSDSNGKSSIFSQWVGDWKKSPR